jgi:uncharacterized damage-inducible protein DinB
MNSTTEHFLHLFKYNDWATNRAGNSIIKTNRLIPEAVKLLSHLISSQFVWLSRVADVKTDVLVWDNFPIDECISKSSEITSEWINLIEGKNNNFLERRIKYQNSKGENFENSLKDILTHLINHSTYHRAQIAQLVKRAGGIPAVTDYIVYQRELQDV